MKSRTNLSTNSGKATKRLGRLAPNLAHMCKFIWDWIYAKQIAPRDTRGALEGFRGQQFKSMGKLSDWHQLWFTSADSSGNGHRLNTSRPSIPRGAFWGGEVRVSQIQKSGEAVKPLTAGPIGTKFGTHLQIHLGMDKRQTNCPSRHKGGTWGVLGVKHSKFWGSCQTAGPIGTNFGSRLRIHLGMDID